MTTLKEPIKKKRKSRAGKLTKLYSTEDRGMALAMVDLFGGAKRPGAIGRASKALGVPRRTLGQWVNEKYGVNSEVKEARDQVKRTLAEGFEEATFRLLTLTVRAAEVAAEKGYARDLSLAAAIFADKRNLMLNLPTKIEQTIQTADKPDERQQYEALLDTIMKDAEERKIPLTRDEAVAQLIKYKPDAAKILAFVPAKTG